MIFELKRIFNGYVAKCKKVKNRKVTYCWHIQGRLAGRVLQEILPYLRTKSEQAQLALEYCKTIKFGPGLAPGIFEKREQIAKQLKEFKKNG